MNLISISACKAFPRSLCFDFFWKSSKQLRWQRDEMSFVRSAFVLGEGLFQQFGSDFLSSLPPGEAGNNRPFLDWCKLNRFGDGICFGESGFWGHLWMFQIGKSKSTSSQCLSQGNRNEKVFKELQVNDWKDF
ncbi:hypothetical protein CEXT_543941 [Caerostris extrusa]|uniref:Uncharacterized protein n=1 Tax=Caerostris extrusa TaxID=172846 RepID=A0AAV4T4L4_CAEEX|nr:hypothetical protein CEXT_543941 [Caerostris extrusa]